MCYEGWNRSLKAIVRQIQVSERGEAAEEVKNGSTEFVGSKAQEGQSGEVADAVRNCSAQLIVGQFQSFKLCESQQAR